MPINGPARDGGAAQCDCELVQETVELMHRESSSPMPDLKGGGHLATGKGGSKEKGGVRTGIAVTTAINMNKCARKAQGMLSS